MKTQDERNIEDENCDEVSLSRKKSKKERITEERGS